MNKHDYDPMGIGLVDVDEDVAVMLREAGGRRRAAILPVSISKLKGAAFEAVSDLQRAAGEVQAAQAAVSELVAECRHAGVSWHAIGWSVGTTGEAARQRWGVDGGGELAG